MNRAIGTLGKSFAQYLAGARRTRRDDDDFTAMLLFLAQSFFEGVGVGLVDFVGNVFANPGACLVEFEGRIFLRHLLHTDQDFHGSLLSAPTRLYAEHVPLCAAPHPGKRVSINDEERWWETTEQGSVEESDRLDGRDVEAFTATHVLTHHDVVFAKHVGASFSEARAVTIVCTRRKTAFFGANNPVNLVLGRLVAVRAVEICRLLVGLLVEKLAFFHKNSRQPFAAGF